MKRFQCHKRLACEDDAGKRKTHRIDRAKRKAECQYNARANRTARIQQKELN